MVTPRGATTQASITAVRAKIAASRIAGAATRRIDIPAAYMAGIMTLSLLARNCQQMTTTHAIGAIR